MIKIIKSGIYVRHTAYCQCGCVFEYDESDVNTEPNLTTTITSDGTTTAAFYGRYVICPECGARVYVPYVIPNVTPPGWPYNPMPHIYYDEEEPCWKKGPNDWPEAPKPMCGTEQKYESVNKTTTVSKGEAK